MARTSFFSGGEVLSEPNCNPRASLGLDWGEAFLNREVWNGTLVASQDWVGLRSPSRGEEGKVP